MCGALKTFFMAREELTYNEDNVKPSKIFLQSRCLFTVE